MVCVCVCVYVYIMHVWICMYSVCMCLLMCVYNCDMFFKLICALVIKHAYLAGILEMICKLRHVNKQILMT